jgi:hypothetical protein
MPPPQLSSITLIFWPSVVRSLITFFIGFLNYQFEGNAELKLNKSKYGRQWLLGANVIDESRTPFRGANASVRMR